MNIQHEKSSLTIKDGVLVKCNKTTTSVFIPDGVTSIGRYAFELCTSLTNVIIPASVTSIRDYAFELCTSLTNATIGSSVTSIGRYAFAGCTSLTSVTIPNSVTSIGNWAFYNCYNLTNVIIPASVTNFEVSAFPLTTKIIRESISKKSNTLDGKTIEIEGIKYKLTEIN